MQERPISRWFLAATLLCAVPVLIPVYPPMVDLPQHVAAIMVLNEVHFGDYAFAEMFEFNWLRPYWLGYSLIWAVSHITGLVWASKLVIAAAIIAFVVSLAWLRREIKAPPLVDWLLLGIPFGYAYEWGFLSFIVAAPMGPLFLVSYHRFLNGTRHWGLIVGWMCLLFFGHLLILAFFAVVASLMALRGRPDLSQLAARVAPLLVSVPIGVGWLLLNMEPRYIENLFDWGIGWQRLTQLLPDLFALEYTPAQSLVAAGLIALPFILGVRPRWSLHGIAPIVFYCLFMLLMPSQLIDNMGTYERFHLFGMMFFILMLEDADENPPSWLPKIRHLVVMLPGIVGLTLLARATIKSHGFNQDAQDFHRMLNVMAPAARAMGLVQYANSEFTRVPVYMHFPVWYQVESKGLVDFNFAQWSSLNTFYKAAYRPVIGSRLPWFPEEYDWELNGGDNYRYFMVSGSSEFVQGIFKGRLDQFSVPYVGRKWILFERIDAVQGDLNGQ